MEDGVVLRGLVEVGALERVCGELTGVTICLFERFLGERGNSEFAAADTVVLL